MVRFVFAAFLVITALQQQTAEAQAPSHVDVVALMVEFQPDTTRFTTGDGTFSGTLFEGVDAPSIDPLPHNADYFEAHLTFLSNYVAGVSDGKSSVTTHLLPGTVQLSKTMGAYSPTGLEADSDEELAKLAAMVQEAWTAAHDQGIRLPASLDPATTAFVLFHAGVGRDIELVGTTLDKTPEDLPSLFFNGDALSRLGAGHIELDGLPIRNTLVLPRTESRLGVNPLTSEPFLIELSINGLLAASFFNYLGVPDLFNTKTGDTAIGPFGVMDALGIFAYSGLFPPEPSAWTKEFLGWRDAADMNAEGRVVLRASGLPGVNHSARIPVSDAEYFLVENRHRDPDGDGVRLQVWTHDGVQEVVFPNGDPEFNDQTISGFPGGVVLEVDDYDFALPGGLDENDNALLGGILIWHVDQNRLDERLESNRVNDDRNARAIDLEEADGAQDIGFSSSSGLFGPRFDLGTPFDFWYEGNPVTVRTNTGQDIQLYANRFAADTTPSSDTNAGGFSGVVLEDFSSPGSEMSFRIGSALDSPVPFLGDWTQQAWGVPTPARGWMAVASDPDGFWSWRPGTEGDAFGGQAVWFRSSPSGTQYFATAGDISPVAWGGDLFVLTEDGLYRDSPSAGTGAYLIEFTDPIDRFTSPSMEWAVVAGKLYLYAGIRRNGQSALLTFSVDTDGMTDVIQTDVSRDIRRVFVTDRQSAEVVLMTNDGLLDGHGTLLLTHPFGAVASASLSKGGSTLSVAWTTDTPADGLQFIDEQGQLRRTRPADDCAPHSPLWYDVDADSRLDIMYTCGNRLLAIHQSGAVVTGFPVRMPTGALSSPVVTRGEDGSVIIVLTTEGGSIDGWSHRDGLTNRLPGFPLALGSPSATIPRFTGGAMAAISGAGTIRTWAMETVGEVVYSDMGAAIAPPTQTRDADFDGLIDGSQTYNWPNPIENGETRIRFATAEPSVVRIDIVDMNGVLVERLEANSSGGGLPAEVTWTTQAGSGVYLARVRAESMTSSRSATRLIKMAIIR